MRESRFCSSEMRTSELELTERNQKKELRRKVELIINWSEKIPVILLCPKCKHYLNLTEDNWEYITPKTRELITDSHLCPKCERVWRILRRHIDEI